MTAWPRGTKSEEKHAAPTTEQAAVRLSDGTIVPAAPGAPISVRITEHGGASDWRSDGAARSPSVSTTAHESALKGDFKSGSPAVVAPSGSVRHGAALGGGGGFDVKALAGSAGSILLWLGAVVFLCGPAAFIFGRKIGVGLSAAQAALVSACGLLLIGIGLRPESASYLILGLAAAGAVMAGLYVWQLRRAAAVDRDATEAEEVGAILAAAIHAEDRGDDSPGRRIKSNVNAAVSRTPALRAALDYLLTKSGGWSM